MKNKLFPLGIIYISFSLLIGLGIGYSFDHEMQRLNTKELKWYSPKYRMPELEKSIICIYKTANGISNVYKMRTLEIDWEIQKDLWWIFDVNTEEVAVYNLGKPLFWAYYPEIQP